MDDLISTEELAFIPEQVEPILYQIIEETLKISIYDPLLVPQLIDLICERCIAELNKANKPYKYIVSCVIMQRNGSGLHSTNSCYWNREDDNLCRVSWPNEKRRDTNNSRMVCVLTAFGVSV